MASIRGMKPVTTPCSHQGGSTQRWPCQIGDCPTMTSVKLKCLSIISTRYRRPESVREWQRLQPSTLSSSHHQRTPCLRGRTMRAMTCLWGLYRVKSIAYSLKCSFCLRNTTLWRQGPLMLRLTYRRYKTRSICSQSRQGHTAHSSSRDPRPN